MRRGAAGITALAAALLLASCSTGPAPGSGAPDPAPDPSAIEGADGPGTAPGPGIYPIVPATHAHVQLSCPLRSAVGFAEAGVDPADVAAVYVCTTAPYADAPDGTPQIQEFVDRVAGADVARLLHAYAVPDEEPTDGACVLMIQDPLIIWIHDGDGAITPVHAPRDGCGFPQADAAGVYQDVELHRVLVAREKLRTA